VALPMLLLYEVGIILAGVSAKKAKAAEEERST
jgi:Sec-independent protein secretion pathway component TatC